MSKSHHPKGERTVRAAGVVLVVLDKKKRPARFLLMRHHDRWDLPKGHCDEEEKFKQTARREFAEETGVDPDSVDWDEDFRWELTYEVTRRGKSRTKRVRYYLATCTKPPTIVPTEHEGFQWFAFSPPHRIQKQTIDGLLAAVTAHFDEKDQL